MLLGLLLGLSIIAAGARVQLTTSLPALALADQAQQQDSPGQPPLRLFATDLVKEDSDTGQAEDLGDCESYSGTRWVTGFADIASQAPVIVATEQPIVLAQRRSGRAQIHECHGPRPPPIR